METKHLDRVVIRFTGDSGDGMQLTGSRFTDATAMVGNDLATLPNFPAEIRAPAGTLAGVSAFQIHFAWRVARGCEIVSGSMLASRASSRSRACWRGRWRNQSKLSHGEARATTAKVTPL